jgi:hypothetical protein
MTTIDKVPNDVIAVHVASRLSAGDLNSVMRSSKRFEMICKKYESVWAPMVRALFLKKQGSNYETVRDFHLRFNDYSDANLPKPEVSVFVRTGNWLKSLLPVSPSKKEIPFESNIQRWRSVESLFDRVADIVMSPLNLDLAIAFQFYQIDPTINYKRQFCIAALEKGYLPQVAWFLENQLIPVKEQGFLLMKAAQMGDLTAVNMLLELGQISERDRFEAIGRTKECDAKAEIIKKLQQDTKLTDELRGAVMIGASTAGNLEMVKKMFEMGPLPLECIVRAYLRANYAHAYSASISEKCGFVMQVLRQGTPELHQRLVPYEQEVHRVPMSPYYAIYSVFNDLKYQQLGNESE